MFAVVELKKLVSLWHLKNFDLKFPNNSIKGISQQKYDFPTDNEWHVKLASSQFILLFTELLSYLRYNLIVSPSFIVPLMIRLNVNMTCRDEALGRQMTPASWRLISWRPKKNDRPKYFRVCFSFMFVNLSSRCCFSAVFFFCYFSLVQFRFWRRDLEQ